MDTPAVLSKGQKILAACGIFLFVGGVSWAYATMKPYAAPTNEASTPIATPPIVPQTAMNPQANPMPTPPPVMSGNVVPEGMYIPSQPAPTVNPWTGETVPGKATEPIITDTQTAPLMETANDTTGLEGALQSQGLTWREDLAWDRTIFDRIIPMANLVSMKSYLVYEGKGATVGRVTFVDAIDPAVTNVYDFLLVLARRDTSGKVSITETTRGRTRIFEYKDLDKTQNLRIVGQVSDKRAFAADLPAYLQPVMDAVLSQL